MKSNIGAKLNIFGLDLPRQKLMRTYIAIIQVNEIANEKLWDFSADEITSSSLDRSKILSPVSYKFFKAIKICMCFFHIAFVWLFQHKVWVCYPKSKLIKSRIMQIRFHYEAQSKYARAQWCHDVQHITAY